MDYGMKMIQKILNLLYLKQKNDRKMDNTKLLLDIIPRSSLGYEFSLENVYYIFLFMFDYIYLSKSFDIVYNLSDI
jgi:hypothetical protein